jgi:hypothetical protein
MIVKTPSTMPKGMKRHSMQATMKQKGVATAVGEFAAGDKHQHRQRPERHDNEQGHYDEKQAQPARGLLSVGIVRERTGEQGNAHRQVDAGKAAKQRGQAGQDVVEDRQEPQVLLIGRGRRRGIIGRGGGHGFIQKRAVQVSV